MKIRKGLLVLVAATTLLTSCLNSTDRVLEPFAAITNFSVGNFKVWYRDVNIHGRDTLISKLESGNMYPMTIDQHKYKIYNIDSISYGAKLDRVLINVEHTGYLYIRKSRADGTTIDSIWSSSDSVDLSKPLTFIAVSEDLKERREYEVKLNVHKIHPDSVTWSKADSVGYKALKEQASVIKNDSIFLFGKDESSIPVFIARSIEKNTEWAAPVQITGIDSEKWNNNIIQYNSGFYMLQDDVLYTSVNGKDWTASSTTERFKYLISTSNSVYSEGVCWALNTAGKIVKSADMVNWEAYQDIPESFPIKNISLCCYPLKSNPKILRTVLVGLKDDALFSKASVWTRLSTDDKWTEITPSSTNDKLLPAKGGLTMMYYDKDLYAFGNGFNAFYQSKDNGVTWRDCSLFNNEYSSWNIYMKFPAELNNKLTKFSSVTDSNNVIWIMTESGQVWRGGINRLMK